MQAAVYILMVLNVLWLYIELVLSI